MEGQGSVWRALATLATLVVLTFTLGVPTSLRFVLGKVWPGLAALGMIALGIRVGFLGDYGGPLGLPVGLLWVVGAAVGGMWLFAFVMITRSAWRNALLAWRQLIEDRPE